MKLKSSDLALESLNPLTIKLNDTVSLQFDNSAIARFAAAAGDAAENYVFVKTEGGGADDALDGANKGADLYQDQPTEYGYESR